MSDRKIYQYRLRKAVMLSIMSTSLAYSEELTEGLSLKTLPPTEVILEEASKRALKGDLIAAFRHYDGKLGDINVLVAGNQHHGWFQGGFSFPKDILQKADLPRHGVGIGYRYLVRDNTPQQEMFLGGYLSAYAKEGYWLYERANIDGGIEVATKNLQCTFNGYGVYQAKDEPNMYTQETSWGYSARLSTYHWQKMGVLGRIHPFFFGARTKVLQQNKSEWVLNGGFGVRWDLIAYRDVTLEVKVVWDTLKTGKRPDVQFGLHTNLTQGSDPAGNYPVHRLQTLPQRYRPDYDNKKLSNGKPASNLPSRDIPSEVEDSSDSDSGSDHEAKNPEKGSQSPQDTYRQVTVGDSKDSSGSDHEAKNPEKGSQSPQDTYRQVTVGDSKDSSGSDHEAKNPEKGSQSPQDTYRQVTVRDSKDSSGSDHEAENPEKGSQSPQDTCRQVTVKDSEDSSDSDSGSDHEAENLAKDSQQVTVEDSSGSDHEAKNPEKDSQQVTVEDSSDSDSGSDHEAKNPEKGSQQVTVEDSEDPSAQKDLKATEKGSQSPQKTSEQVKATNNVGSNTTTGAASSNLAQMDRTVQPGEVKKAIENSFSGRRPSSATRLPTGSNLPTLGGRRSSLSAVSSTGSDLEKKIPPKFVGSPKHSSVKPSAEDYLEGARRPRSSSASKTPSLGNNRFSTLQGGVEDSRK